MTFLDAYFQKISHTFKNEHLIFFILVIFSLQILDYFLAPYKVKVYSFASIMMTYCFLNLNTSIYKLVMGGITSTFVSFVIYKIMMNTFTLKKINISLANLITFVFVITSMVLLNCVFMPAIAYSVLPFQEIPKSEFTFLTSYIFSGIAVVISCIIILNITKFLNNHTVKFKNIDTFYQQLEQNISNKNN